MILDNLSRALKTQNWLAAGVEFVIVIAGVVIGFQIQAWAQDRSEREYARRIFTQVELEIGEIASVRDVTREGLRQHIESLTDASLIITGRFEADRLTPDQCAAVASSGRTTLAPDSLPAIEELLDTGVLSNTGDDGLRLVASRFITKQNAVREWARLRHLELHDLADLFPNQVRFVFSETPDENGQWSQQALCDLEAMRGSVEFQALLMSNLERDRTTLSFVYDFMNEAFEELRAAINAELRPTPAEPAP